KTQGWEFTELTGLDLNAYAPAQRNGASATEAAPILPTPEDAAFLRQVDSHALGSELAEPAAGERPSKPVVMPLSDAAAAYPELVRRHLGSLVAADDVFVAHNEA